MGNEIVNLDIILKKNRIRLVNDFQLPENLNDENRKAPSSVREKIMNVCNSIGDGIYDLYQTIHVKLLALRERVSESWDKLSLPRQKKLIAQIAALSLMFIAFICFCCGNLPAGCTFACLVLAVHPVKWIIDTFETQFR